VSDTPDNRLTITPNADGSGAIEYANKITENKDKNSQNTHNETTGESHVDSTDKVTSHNEAETNSNASSKDVLASDINEIEDYINHKVGKSGTVSYPQLVKEYRESLLRIEKTIFGDKETQQLFMLVY
jgi:TATA-binding protein-associated factor Taf7